nr:AI-2E family transporter [bacterium]
MKKRAWLQYAIALFVGLSLFWVFQQTLLYIPSWLRTLNGILLPITVGLITGYILLPAVRLLEKLWEKMFPRLNGKGKTGFAVLVVFIILFGLIALFCVLLLPRFVKNFIEFANGLPGYLASLKEWINKFIEDNPVLQTPGVKEQIESYFANMGDSILAWAQGAVVKLLSGVYGFAVSTGKVIMGVIAAIYLLLEREQLSKVCKGLLGNLLGPKRMGTAMGFMRQADHVFGRFLSARLLESVVIMVVAMIGFIILKVPYASLLAVATGLLNLIPYFGAWIAGILTTVITLLAQPQSVIPVVIFQLALQCFDGWWLSPALFGERLKLSGFMVIIAITVFGGFFGLWGMMLGVPLFSLLLLTIQRCSTIVARRREKRDAAEPGAAPPDNTHSA